jgi:hypothetical protein
MRERRDGAREGEGGRGHKRGKEGVPTGDRGREKEAMREGEGGHEEGRGRA